MTWLAGFFGKFKGWIALAGAAVIAIGVAFVRGRAEGMKVITAEQDRRRLEAARNRKEIDDEVDQLGATDIDREYDRWLRDGDR